MILLRLESGNTLSLRRKPDFIIPTYDKISAYRHQLVPSSEIGIVKYIGYPVGVTMKYHEILSITTERLVESIGPIDISHYPLTIDLVDGLDGSGIYNVYNQINTNLDFSTKSFILFAFKILKVTNMKGEKLWTDDTPNSPFVTRPIALISMKENHKNVNFLMI